MKKLFIFLFMLSFSFSNVFAGRVIDKIRNAVDSAFEEKLYSTTILSQEMKTSVNVMVKDVFENANKNLDASHDEYEKGLTGIGYDSVKLRPHYIEIAEQLHSGGYAKRETYQQFVTEYDSLKNLTLPSHVVSEDEKKNFWKNKYEDLFTRYMNNIGSNPQVCASEGVPSNNKKCCAGLIELTLVKDTVQSCSSGGSCSDNSQCCSGICRRDSMNQAGTCAPASCIASAGSCNEDSDCCSNVCNKDDPNAPGRCMTPKQCYRPAPLGAECGNSLSPICETGICDQVDAGTIGASCLEVGKQCSDNTECCSSSCVNNKCESKMICKDCATKGQIPSDGKQCCEGYYQDATTKKCKIDIHPMNYVLPPATSSTNIFKKIFDLIIPSAHAINQEYINAETELDDNFAIGQASAQCAQQFNPSTNERGYEACLRQAQHLVGQDSARNAGLTEEQKAEFKKKYEECGQTNVAGSIGYNQCIANVDKEKAETITKNEEDGVLAGNKPAELIKKYKTPGVTEKTYSDPKNCVFHSYNDNWRAATDLEKNAELFMRSFEFVYSGEGAKDYWQDGKKGNIYERARKVAIGFRKNRSAIIQEMNELDRKMTCQCIAIWGPKRFDAEKQSFFNSEACTEERQKVAAQLGEEVDANKSGGSRSGGASNIGSIDSTKDDDKDLSDQINAEEIDKGALGISHERLLVEWLGLRADAQVNRFTNNAVLEKELLELSTFIEDWDFEEVWKGELSEDGKTLLNCNADRDNNMQGLTEGKGDCELLYRFGIKYYKGWVKLFVMVALGSIGVFWGGPLLASAFKAIGTVLGGVIGGLVGGAMGGVVASILGIYGANGQPGIGDLQTFKKKSYSWTKNWDGYERYYLGPYYTNKSKVKDNECKVYGAASACLVSAYQIQLKDLKYLDSYNNRWHYLVDVQKPLFSKKNYALEKMPGMSKTWVDLTNETRMDGVDALVKTANWTPNQGKSRGGKKYKVKKPKYLKRDVFQEVIDKNYFKVQRGNFQPVQFDHRSDLLDAAVLYATCKEIDDQNNQKCFANQNNTLEEGAIGFGYLFESEDEAKEWAKYTYEMHYLYSNLTKSDKLGYPLLGQDAYFRAVAYNLKLVGSLAAQRAQGYGSAFNKYKADWEQRIGMYKALGESELGNLSKNIKFGERFHNTFAALDFSAGTFGNFDEMMKSGLASNSFSKGEIAALNAGRGAIKSIQDQKKKIAEYQEQRGNNPDSIRRNKSAALFYQKMNSPLAAFKMNKLGGGYGYGAVADALGLLNKNISSLNKKMDQKGNAANFDFGNNFKSPKIVMPNFGSGSSSGSGLPPKTGIVPSNGMNAGQVDQMLEAIKKDKNLDPLESDTLWTVISKAYKRNYSRVLRRNTISDDGDVTNTSKPKKKTKEQKELQKLLESH